MVGRNRKATGLFHLTRAGRTWLRAARTGVLFASARKRPNKETTVANITRREFTLSSAASFAALAPNAARRDTTLRRARTAAKRKGLAIIHTNDTHGHDIADDETFGMAAVPALRESLELDGYEVLVLDAGDACQGTVLVNQSKGKAAIDLMNEVGYDAMALGNHEFDYGMQTLQGLMAQATFPLLAANVSYTDTGERVAEAHATFTLKDGTKVGVFGLTTPETKGSLIAQGIEEVKIAEGEELYRAAQEAADELRAEGCGLVVALAHLGEEDFNEPNRAIDVASHVTGVDIVIDGHDHKEEQRVVADAAGNDVLLVETGCYHHALGVITYEGGKLASTLLHPGDFQGQDSAVAALADSINSDIDRELGVVIATTDHFLYAERPGVREHETNLADLVCDAFLWAAQTSGVSDIVCAIIGGASVRSSIEVGDITMKDVLSVLPYNNDLVTATVTGAQLLEAIEASSSACPEELNGFALVAGITYQIDTRVPFESAGNYPNSTYDRPARPGGRVTIKTVGGAPFDERASYTLVTTSYHMSSTDSYQALRDAGTTRPFGMLDYEALSGYLTDALAGTVGADYADENGQGRIAIIM